MKSGASARFGQIRISEKTTTTPLALPSFPLPLPLSLCASSLFLVREVKEVHGIVQSKYQTQYIHTNKYMTIHIYIYIYFVYVCVNFLCSDSKEEEKRREEKLRDLNTGHLKTEEDRSERGR
jgi:hypothetical protein